VAVAGLVWPADRAWELGIRWFSADGGAKQGVCRGYSGRLFIWTIIGQRTKACIADLQLMCKRDSRRAPSSREVSQMHLPRKNEISGF